MKKHLILFPLLGMLLSGCSFLDNFFSNSTDAGSSQKEEEKPSGEEGGNEQGEQQGSEQGQEGGEQQGGGENQGGEQQSGGENQGGEQQGGNEGGEQSQGGGENQGGENTPPTPAVVHVESVILSEDTLTLNETESETLTYTVTPTNADDQSVIWSTSNALVASVVEGKVTGINEGTAVITVASNDGNHTDTCLVTVNKLEPEVKTVTKTYSFTDDYAKETNPFTALINMDENISFHFDQGSAANAPITDKEGKTYHARLYPGNTITITSSEPTIKKVEFTFASGESSHTITSDVGSYVEPSWTGSSKEVVFTNAQEKAGGHRRIATISVTYEGEVEDPEEMKNLGVMSIADVKQYIIDHPISTSNMNGIWVNEKRYVTIKGFAVAKIDLVKTTKTFGLDVSLPGKVIMADSSGVIGCAGQVTGDGNSLWGKVDDYVCGSSSKYVVSGYLSYYLGQPEILIDTFVWQENLDISYDPTTFASELEGLSDFYTTAKNVNYNCAGHGYGEVVTLKNLKCYYSESDGQHKRYYNFTDGTQNIRVNAFNLGTLTVGSYYDVTGIISLKNLSPIIVAFKFATPGESSPFTFDYESVATEISIENLKKIKGSQDDTLTRYPDVVGAYGTVYKTTGFLTLVEENNKYYVGISDNFINREDLISGKTKAMADYGISLIKNNDFWNTTEAALYKFNPLFDEYVLENKEITVYYVVRQLDYSSDKAMWQILLLPDFIDSLQAE